MTSIETIHDLSAAKEVRKIDPFTITICGLFHFFSLNSP